MKKLIKADAQVQNIEWSLRDKSQSPGGWLVTWSKEVDRTPNICSYFGCSNKAQVGGHLRIKDLSIKFYYIAPICILCDNELHGESSFYDTKANTAFLKMKVLSNAIELQPIKVTSFKMKKEIKNDAEVENVEGSLCNRSESSSLKRKILITDDAQIQNIEGSLCDRSQSTSLKKKKINLKKKKITKDDAEIQNIEELLCYRSQSTSFKMEKLIKDNVQLKSIKETSCDKSQSTSFKTKKLIKDDAQVQNVEESLCDKSKSPGNWLATWSKGVDRTYNICSYFGCANKAQVGGHLWIKDLSRKFYYIAPICISCSNEKHDQNSFYDTKANTAFLKMKFDPCTYKN